MPAPIVGTPAAALYSGLLHCYKARMLPVFSKARTVTLRAARIIGPAFA
jgi:hypothetical protein